MIYSDSMDSLLSIGIFFSNIVEVKKLMDLTAIRNAVLWDGWIEGSGSERTFAIIFALSTN